MIFSKGIIPLLFIIFMHLNLSVGEATRDPFFLLLARINKDIYSFKLNIKKLECYNKIDNNKNCNVHKVKAEFQKNNLEDKLKELVDYKNRASTF